MTDFVTVEIISFPEDILGEIAGYLQDYPLAREVSKAFFRKIPPTPEYQQYLGVAADDPNLVASAIARKPDFKIDLCKKAAFEGSLAVLKWARKNGCPWDSWICENAAKNGHMQVLKWARENGCDWDRWTCTYAAKGGHFEVLKWARENGCEWDSRTCVRAAENGHLEVLKWARENGCEWNSRTWVYAALNYHFNILDWIGSQIVFDKALFLDSVIHGHTKLKKWLKTNGYDIYYGFYNIRVYDEIQTPEGHQRILGLFREHGLID